MPKQCRAMMMLRFLDALDQQLSGGDSKSQHWFRVVEAGTWMPHSRERLRISATSCRARRSCCQGPHRVIMVL